MARINLIILVLFFTFTLTYSQVIEKYMTEISYETEESVIRFRPFDNTSGTQSIDIVTGSKLRPSVMLGSYWKADFNGNSWTGIILEGRARLKNVHTKIETRFFRAITDNTPDQIYAIPSIYYKSESFPILGFGMCGYSIVQKGSNPFASFGPIASLNFGNRTYMFGYLWDVYSSKDIFIFKIGYKL